MHNPFPLFWRADCDREVPGGVLPARLPGHGGAAPQGALLHPAHRGPRRRHKRPQVLRDAGQGEVSYEAERNHVLNFLYHVKS